ncbi:cytochrome P460 family protein [Lysobacter terrae]
MRKLTFSIAVAALALLVGAGLYASPKQNKYTLKSPSGIAFADFKGYEDWSVVSSARTDEVLKVIVANPTMIQAYKAGVPGNGKPFPEGSKIAKLQWKFKKSTEAPFAVDVPDVFSQAFVIEKDSKRFPKSGGWGYALFNYDAAADNWTADAASKSDCGHACHVKVAKKDHIFHPYQMR